MKHISQSMGLATLLLILCMFRLGSSSRTLLREVNSNVFDVINFGAVGDGEHDDSKAFLAAWTAACGSCSGAATIAIPPKTYLLGPLKFEGPCKSSSINVQVMGTLVALDMNSWPDQNCLKWIVFSQVDGLAVTGNGVLDGRGSVWWTKYTKETHKRPTALAFDNCNNLMLHGLKHKDPARNHISVHKCDTVSISNLQITAPEDSPNTDGIDLSMSTNVKIDDCVIATGDDCVAMNSGSAKIFISKVACGPGHGISIGSLGEDGATDTVEEIYVRHVTFFQTKYGARIKTWQGGLGYARHIYYQDITLVEANHPILINQFYCDKHSSAPCKNSTEAVKISDVAFDGIHGTAASEDAIQLSCSETYGCDGIILNNINITPIDPREQITVQCENAHGRCTGTNPPVGCLLN